MLWYYFCFLSQISALSLPLPPKKLIGNMEREFIAERQKGLQSYLDVITTNHILSNCELVKKFLDPNNYSVNYTGKWNIFKWHLRKTTVYRTQMKFVTDPRKRLISFSTCPITFCGSFVVKGRVGAWKDWLFTGVWGKMKKSHCTAYC